MEDYVDNTLVKSTKWNTHLQDLGPILDQMEKFSLRPNPKTCAFDVMSGKLLGYIVPTKGVKVDSKKVQAIMNMPPTCNIS